MKSSDSTSQTLASWIAQQPKVDRSELREAVKDLKEMFRQRTVGSLVWQHALGQCCQRFFGEADRPGSSRLIRLLAEELAKSKDAPAPTQLADMLWLARRLARTFSAEEVEELAAKRTLFASRWLLRDRLRHEVMDLPRQPVHVPLAVRVQSAAQERHAQTPFWIEPQ